MGEIWKAIPGYENMYEVSSLGRVRSLDREKLTSHGVTRRYKGQILRPYMYKYKKQGYSRAFVNLGHGNPQLVHRLVASAFCERPEGCNVVNHLDCNPENNNAENLEWTTHKKNSEHAVENGLHAAAAPQGSAKFFAKLTEKDVEKIIIRLSNKEPQKEIASDYGVARPIISNINRGIAWRHVKVPGCGNPPYHLRRGK